jgi:hypothetical protein
MIHIEGKDPATNHIIDSEKWSKYTLGKQLAIGMSKIKRSRMVSEASQKTVPSIYPPPTVTFS